MNWKRISIGLFILLILITISDGLLIRQNLELRRRIPTETEGLKVGAQLPPLSATGVAGQQVDVRYDGTGPRHIYFYFTSTCKFCRQQFPFWKEIIEKSAGNDLEAIGLVRESEDKDRLRQFLQQMGCSPESSTPLKIAFINDRLRRDYGLSATPVTLLTNNRGAVEKSWVGAWGESERADAESLLKFSLASQ